MSFTTVTLHILAVVLFIVCMAIWSIHLVAICYGKYKFHKKPRRPYDPNGTGGGSSDKLPGVSVIKPLMNVDDNLAENLTTYFELDYPIYELLFCVQDSADPVISLVQDLIDKYPLVDAKLYIGGKNVGINPKINNMMQGYDVAKYELILISDAGIKMAPDTLYDMVSLMSDKVGLVHQMPFTTDRSGFAGTLEKVYFGTGHCRMYLFINLVGINCVTGMSCLMRKVVLDKIGGLQAFGNYIAEDYFLAQAFLDNKWLIQLSHQPALQNNANYSIPSWKKRMVRWCKLRLKLTPAAWLEPMQECFMLGLCTSWTVNYLFGWNSLVFFLIHVLGWFICDYIILSIAQNGRLPFSKLEYLIAWLYRESICIYLFLKASIDPTVKWRNGRYRLKYGGLAEEIIEPNKPGSNNSSLDVEKNTNILDSPTAQSRNPSAQLNNTASRKNLNLASFNSIYTSSKSSGTNQSHKRTNSHTLNLNYSASQNSLNKDGISYGHFGSNSDLHNSNNAPIRSHHVHHHSISNPIHQSNSTAALIDLSISPLAKSPDKDLDKIV